MRLKTVFVIAAMVFITAGAFAQQQTWNLTYDRTSTTFFLPNEFSLDFFGTWADRDRFGDKSEDFGGGIGVGYFINRYIGIMADSYIEELKAPYRLNGSVVFRLPIDTMRLAPYAFGGGGRQWKYVPQWSGHVGGGVEFRLNPKAGLFSDVRVVFPEDTEDTTLVRFGLKVVF